jgi:hypothetical protein
MKNVFRHKFLSISLSAIILIALGTGCHRNCDPAIVNLNISLSWDGVPVSISDTVAYSINMPLRLEKFRCYINDISLRDLEGNWLPSGSIDLIEFLPSYDKASGEFAADLLRKNNEFDAIRFGLGVYPEINALDNAPSTFPNESPLSVMGSAGMYWTWATGYIFTKYEGKIAVAQGEDLTIPFAFHTGTDELYREVTLELPEVVTVCEEEVRDFNIELDLLIAISGLEDSIDLVEDGITHTINNPELAERFVNLLDDAWSLSE